VVPRSMPITLAMGVSFLSEPPGPSLRHSARRFLVSYPYECRAPGPHAEVALADGYI